MKLKELTKKIDEILSNINEKKENKLIILLIFHNLLVYICIVYLIIGDKGMVYNVVIMIMILILLMNYKYRGCPLLKLEREYMNSKEWYGGYHCLELLGIKIDKENVNSMFRIWIIMITLIIIKKLNFIF
jgi:hypothetical protein